MAQDRFLALCIFSALRSGGAVFAKVGSALVFPVSVPVCGGIMQRAVFRADHVVEIFIVNIRPPGMAVLLGFRAGVAGGQSAVALKNTLADPGRFVGAVRYNGLMFGIVFTQFVIQRVKRYAVMHVAGGDMDAENKIVLVTGGMRFIRKTLFVFALVENAALRVGCGYHRFFLFGRLFVAVVRKGLFSVFFPVFVYLFEQFSCISLRLFRHRLFGLLFQVCAGLDMRSVHEYSLCVQIAFLRSCFQHPTEYIFYRRVVEPVLEIITHCGKVRYRFVQRIPDKPPVRQVHAHFFQRPAK